MSVMILSAGLGTRFAPLSTWTAKPLAPVGDRPMLGHVLSRVRAFGGKTVVNVHHHAAQVRAFLEGDAPNVFISEEKELLGTAGGVQRASSRLGDEDVLIWNGDILADVDVLALRRVHAEGSASATLVVRPAASDEGNVGIDAHGHVVRLRRDVARPGEVRSGDFVGIQVLGASLYPRMPERGGLIEDLYQPLLAEGGHVQIFEVRTPFHDIGTVATYLAANLAWLTQKGGSSFLAEGAQVDAGVALEASIVGKGARVEGQGRLERCVVWPGSRAVAPLVGAVVTPFGVARAA